MSNYSNKLKLIESLYKVAVDPLRYEELLTQSSRVIDRLILNGEDKLDDKELADHISRAELILERLEEFAGDPRLLPLAKTIDYDPNPAILVSDTGKILALNALASDQLGAKKGKNIQSLSLGSKTPGQKMKILLNGLAEKSQSVEGIVGLVELEPVDDSEPVLLALSRVQCRCDENVAGLLTNLAPMWSKRTIAALQMHFELTRAEIEVIGELVAGRNVTQISSIRETSVHTVRSQIKAILHKTNMASQVDLIRHIGFIQRYEPTARQDAGDNCDLAQVKNKSRQMSLQLANGSKLDYALNGPGEGTPVLYIHGMVDSIKLTEETHNQLIAHDILLITPARPGFGSFDANPNVDEPREQFADLMIELLDHLGIERLPVIAHMAGAVYAHALAGFHSARVDAVICVAGAVPIVSRKQYKEMSPGFRLVAHATTQIPGLIPLFFKGATALVRSGREDIILRRAYEGAQADRALSADPEIKSLMFDRYQFTARRGHGAFQTDLYQISSNWSELMEKVECPVILVHGQDDQVVSIQSVRDFAESTRNCKLVEVSDAGQLVFCVEPAVVFDQISKIRTRYPDAAARTQVSGRFSAR